MKSFDPLLSLFASTIQDFRRAEGKIYKLHYVLLFSLFAIVSGANSYRTIESYIQTHLRELKKAFKIKWRKAPAHNEISFVLQGINPDEIEKVVRLHAEMLNKNNEKGSARCIGFDGKTLKGSFDAMIDVKAKQVLSAFATDSLLVLAHVEIDEKTNEIPAVQKLFEELDLKERIVTADAMHCQKKHSRPPKKPGRT